MHYCSERLAQAHLQLSSAAVPTLVAKRESTGQGEHVLIAALVHEKMDPERVGDVVGDRRLVLGELWYAAATVSRTCYPSIVWSSEGRFIAVCLARTSILFFRNGRRRLVLVSPRLAWACITFFFAA